MSNGVTRRQFLQASAMAAAATVLSGCTVNLQRAETLASYVQPPEEGLPGENLWFSTTCRQCSAGCGIVVRTSEGRARKVEGNSLHPVNQGKLCARGQAALQELYDPDRLQGAVAQKGGRLSASYAPWAWEDLVPLVAGWLTNARPGAVAFLGGNTSTHLAGIARQFLDALGAPPPVFYTLGDHLEGRQLLLESSSSLYGAQALPFFDVGQADVVFSFGANFLETWISPVQYSLAYGQMRSRELGKRGYLVQFEPRYSSTAASADEWVPLQPGTEGLVALALGKILVDGAPGVAAVPSAATMRALYGQVDVGAVADVSGVPVADLQRLAYTLAAVPAPLAVPGGSLATHGNGAASLTAVGALNAVLSRLGQPGGVFLPATMDNPLFARLLPSSLADLQALIQRMAAGQVQVLFIHGSNPIFELPPSLGFADAVDNVERVISFSSAVDETSLHADLLLPDHTNLESWGYHVPALADRPVVGSLQPVARPLYDTRATADVLLALAQEVGGSLAQRLPWPNEVDLLKDRVGSLAPTGTASDVFWSQFRRQGGQWPESANWSSPSSALALDRPLSVPAPAVEETTVARPYTLHLYPSITVFDGRGANKSWLQETPDPMTTVAWQTWIEIHPTTAQKLGVQDGDVVTVSSTAGEIEALVYVYPGILEDVVAMPIGRGHEQYGRYARGQGSNPMQLLSLLPSGALSAPSVSIQPTGRRKALARLESPEGVAYLQSES